MSGFGPRTNLTEEQLEELSKFQREARGRYEWKLEWRWVPRKCCISGKWTPWFRKIYVGRRVGQLIKTEYSHLDIKHARVDEFTWAILRGDKLPE